MLLENVLAEGLTTGHAPFVEKARQRGELFIRQAYDLYSKENHEAWRKLFARMQPRWERYANPHFLAGVEALDLPHDRIPVLTEVNAPQPLTGFQAKPVSGYVPGFLFFDCLRRREFPTTITIRPPTAWTTCLSPTSSTTSPATSPCTPTASSPTPSCVSASAPIPPSK